MRILKICLLIIGLTLMLFWVGSILYCEYLTYTYGHEFEIVHEEISHTILPSKWKVIKRSETYAEVYFFSDHGGVLVSCNKENGEWKLDMWKAAWSKGGTADDLIWPYIR